VRDWKFAHRFSNGGAFRALRDQGPVEILELATEVLDTFVTLLAFSVGGSRQQHVGYEHASEYNITRYPMIQRRDGASCQQHTRNSNTANLGMHNGLELGCDAVET
jgi:hypothetical protein